MDFRTVQVHLWFFFFFGPITTIFLDLDDPSPMQANNLQTDFDWLHEDHFKNQNELIIYISIKNEKLINNQDEAIRLIVS